MLVGLCLSYFMWLLIQVWICASGWTVPQPVTHAAECPPGAEQNPQQPAVKGRTLFSRLQPVLQERKRGLDFFLFCFKTHTFCVPASQKQLEQPKIFQRGSTCSLTWTLFPIQMPSENPTESTSFIQHSSSSVLRSIYKSEHMCWLKLQTVSNMIMSTDQRLKVRIFQLTACSKINSQFWTSKHI